MSVAMESEGLSKADAALDVARPKQAASLVDAMRQMTAAAGTGYGGLIREFARLALGPGRLGFDEYMTLGLFDAKRYAGTDKKAFVGLTASRKIWTQANFRFDLLGLAMNKIASSALFGAYGFPTIPLLALYSGRAGKASGRMLAGAEALRAFLLDPSHYPLFGKPMGGTQSLGSASFDGIDATKRELIAYGGRRVPLESFVAEVAANYADGYLFQRRVSPHRDVLSLCGDRLSTVRVLTVIRGGVPKILRACWKIPAGENAADNFWRSGNILARLDLETGRVTAALRGTGLGISEPSHHPDSSAPILGATVPSWRAVKETALGAAEVLPDLALIGWDIAPVDGGALLVECNQAPDFILPQMADARGILDEEFKAFLAERKALAKAEARAAKGRLKRNALGAFEPGSDEKTEA
ncbi:MAG TPA: sugar-transfer associated ATP-grasp domain-containing protein [Stellaceae bacterium]|nr:sugar-transfer associated ATP-grasp domain-containing protein [Stellaceae bacterium]